VKEQVMTEYVETRPVGFSELSAVVGSAPPVAQNVTYERIREARSEPHNWLTYYGAYDGQRYSPLDQINTENVKQLVPAWVFQWGAAGMHAGPSTYAFEAAPIVVDGVMFVSGWDSWVWAIDARTGENLWVYKHAVPFDTSLCCGNVNRGVAVAQGKVFVVTLNAHVVALDAATGKCVWDRTYGDVRAGESGTVAPLVVKNLVIVGSSGGEFGVRGHPCGAATRSRSPGSRGRTHGPLTVRPGRGAVATAGSRAPTTRRRTSCTGGPGIPGRTSTERCVRGTTSTPTA
jgi:alcohol dehydrogenase (cytochrome c)